MAKIRSPKKAAAPQNSLTEKLRHLSPKRQEIIRPVLENPRSYVLLSVRALADRLGTDPATTVRIVQGLGFPTYKDFQRHLHDLSVAYATSLDTMKAAEHEGSGPAAFVRAALNRDMQNLHALNNSLNADKVCALAKRLYEADKILLLGGDAATVAGSSFGVSPDGDRLSGVFGYHDWPDQSCDSDRQQEGRGHWH